MLFEELNPVYKTPTDEQFDDARIPKPVETRIKNRGQPDEEVIHPIHFFIIRDICIITSFYNSDWNTLHDGVIPELVDWIKINDPKNKDKVSITACAEWIQTRVFANKNGLHGVIRRFRQNLHRRLDEHTEVREYVLWSLLYDLLGLAKAKVKSEEKSLKRKRTEQHQAPEHSEGGYLQQESLNEQPQAHDGDGNDAEPTLQPHNEDVDMADAEGLSALGPHSADPAEDNLTDRQPLATMTAINRMGSKDTDMDTTFNTTK